MKGLMYKELYLSRKSRIIGAAVYFVVLMLFVMIKLSILYGNLGKLDEGITDNLQSIVYYIMVFGCAIVLFTSQYTSCIHADEKAGFRIYEHTLPVSERAIVGAVYLVNLCFLGVVTLVTYINMFIANALFGKSLEPMYLIYLFGIGCVFFMGMHGKMALDYWLRNPKRSSAIMSCTFFVIYFGAAFGIMGWLNSYYEKLGVDMYGDEMEKEAALDALGITENQLISRFFDDELMPKVRWIGSNSWWLIPLVLFTLTAVWYFVSVKSLKRRGAK